MPHANPTLGSAREKYLKGLHRRRRARTTIAPAERETLALINSLPPGVERTRDLTAEHVAAYVSEKYPGLADGTFNLYVGHLRRWLEWCALEGYFGSKQTPWRYLEAREKPMPKRQKAFIRKEEMLALAQAAGRTHPRNEYFIKCVYYMARRMGEVRWMKVGDVDFTPRPDMRLGTFTFVNTKGRRVETFSLYPALREVLDEWLEIYEKSIGRPLHKDDYLFPALRPGSAKVRAGVRMPMDLRPKTVMSYRAAQDSLRRALDELGTYEEGKALHGLRRGALSDFFAECRDIRLVKTFASHTTTTTTELYLDTTQDKQDLARVLNGGGDQTPQAAPGPEQPDVVDLGAFRRRRAGA